MDCGKEKCAKYLMKRDIRIDGRNRTVKEKKSENLEKQKIRNT